MLSSDLRETALSIFMVESPPSPLYLLGNLQSGKVRKKLRSLEESEVGGELPATALYLYKKHPDEKK